MLAANSIAEVTALSPVQIRYQICPGVLQWRAQSGDARARPERDFTISRAAFRGGASCTTDHSVAAGRSARFKRRNLAARPACRLSRWQERTLRTRKGTQD